MASKALPSLILCTAVLIDYAWRLIAMALVLASACIIIVSVTYAITTGDWRSLPVALMALALNIWSQKAFDDSFDGEVADAVEDFGDRLLRRRAAA